MIPNRQGQCPYAEQGLFIIIFFAWYPFYDSRTWGTLPVGGASRYWLIGQYPTPRKGKNNINNIITK